MSFSRENMSPRYRMLLQQYKALHEEGEKNLGLPPEATFPGQSLFAQATRIKSMIERTNAELILDYGSGKGKQYDPHPIKIGGVGEWPNIIEYWDVSEVVCFDPSYEPFNKLPQGKFDGVISTDVLEHCPEEDIPWILDEIFGYAKKFVFANIACYPAKKHLPNGENAHCTIKPPEWWQVHLEETAKHHPGLLWEVWLQYKMETSEGSKLVEQRIGN